MEGPSRLRERTPRRPLVEHRSAIFSEGLDQSIAAFGLRVLKSPPRSLKANALCERLIGTIWRECLDWLIPLSEHHLRSLLKMWAVHYNRSRPHMGLGPGVPDPAAPPSRPNIERGRHRLELVLVCASNRYSVAFTMSTIGRVRAFDPIFAQHSQ